MAFKSWACAIVLATAGAFPGPAGAVNPPSWTWYGDESYMAESLGYAGASSGGAAASAGVSTAASTALAAYTRFTETAGLRPANPDDGGARSCAFYISAPYGHWGNDGSLQAEVRADVECDFQSAEITYTVQFQGHDPASGSFVELGRSVTCRGTSHCTNGVAFHNTSRACKGSFDHYGVAYGTYLKPDGSTHRIIGNGIEGPHKRGQSFSRYC